MIQVAWLIVSAIVGGIAAVLAWRCNKGMFSKMFISTYAFFFGILYLPWYFFYQKFIQM
jgi:uncharacterized membrane protein YeaQ/YmgE (transglycosylase-associated protein family)